MVLRDVNNRIGADREIDRRIVSGSQLDEHTIGDFTRTSESLFIREAIVATESTDRLALARFKRQRRMLTNRIPQLPQLSVNPILSQCGLKRCRIEARRSSSKSSANRIGSAVLRDLKAILNGPCGGSHSTSI